MRPGLRLSRLVSHRLVIVEIAGLTTLRSYDPDVCLPGDLQLIAPHALLLKVLGSTSVNRIGIK